MTPQQREGFQLVEPGSEELRRAARSCWARSVEVFAGESRKGDPLPPGKDGSPQWEWKRKLGELALEPTEEFQAITFEPVETEYVMIRITSNGGGDFVTLGEVEVIAADRDAPPPDAHAHAADVWPNVAAIGHRPGISWQLLAYLLLTAAEVMVSITFLEFSYTQAPSSMKSIIMSLFLMTVSLGNLFTALVNFFVENPDGSSQLEGAAYYWFFTAVMAVTAVLFVIASQFYRGRTYIQGDDEIVEEAKAEGLEG